MSKLIRWFGGRKFIIAQEVMVLMTLLAMTDNLTTRATAILGMVAAGYGLANVARAAIDKKTTISPAELLGKTEGE